MKNVFMSFAVIATMVAVAACGNNAAKSEAAAEEVAECCGADSCAACADSCAACDSVAVEAVAE